MAMLLSLFCLLAAAAPSLQEGEDDARGLWNKVFRRARDRASAKGKQTIAKPQTTVTKPQVAVRPRVRSSAVEPSAPSAEALAEAIEEELIGVTIWRLRYATKSDDQSEPRLLVQKTGAPASQSSTQRDELLAERVNADTPFSEGQMLRLGIEAPRNRASYLYVIDREVYADGTMSDPYLIFPAKSTPSGDEVVAAGKIVYVPSRNDEIPFFTLQRSREGQDKIIVSERLTIIVNPQPLDLPLADGPLRLDPVRVAQWEKQWGSTPERREARDSTGRGWTVAEKDAGEGKRLLVQSDPLPQTIYRVKAKLGKPVLVTVLLRISQK
jgi:hypothetical protein